MQSHRLRLAIDMDEVIADFLVAQRDWYRKHHGYNWVDAELVGRQAEDLAERLHVEAMEAHLHEGAFFRDLPVMTGAQSAIRRLQDVFDVFIVTAAMEYPLCCEAKYLWLKDHFPFISPLNVVFCGDKGIVAADYLLDDNLRFLRAFRGTGVMFTAPHNLHADWTPRVSGWAEAEAFFHAKAGRSVG